MIEKLSTFVVKRRWWIVLFWIVATIAIVGLSPKLSSIESDDQSSFLPKTYESIKASEIAKNISAKANAPTDIIVFANKSNTELTPVQKVEIGRVIGQVNNMHIDRVVSVTTNEQQLAPNKKVQLATITYEGTGNEKSTINAVQDVRDALSSATKNTDITSGVTGSIAISFDTQDSSNRALQIVSIGTLLLVLILPAFIFRSIFAGLFPLLAVSLVFTLSSSLIALAGHVFDFRVSQQLSILFTVVLFGIGTDYILFLLFRYRERLRTGDHTREAVTYALSRAGEAILSAALVVLTSFAALFFADFGIFSSLAPGLVICVAVMMLAALTLIPALLAIVGDKIFWPSKAWKSQSMKPTLSKKVGGLIARRPGLVSSVVIVVLLVVGVFATTFRADFTSFSQPPKGTQSAEAYDKLTSAFPAGVLNPTQIYIVSDTALTPEVVKPIIQKLSGTHGVSAVFPGANSEDGKTVALTVILKEDAYSNNALDDVSGPIREAAHTFNSDTLEVRVGGVTSIFADVRTVTGRDIRVIFPIAALFIFVILAVLLRSLVAPIVLLLCVSLGYAATLGATTLIFQTFGSSYGIISFIPLFMYIFVVAIGTDYNILTITRLREEVKEGNDPRRAADLTVEHSSATVVAAGLILAATFGSLMLGGLTFLTQMGAAIAIGVSLAAFVIAPFLIPSLSAVIGYRIWWPGHSALQPKKSKKK